MTIAELMDPKKELDSFVKNTSPWWVTNYDNSNNTSQWWEFNYNNLIKNNQLNDYQQSINQNNLFENQNHLGVPTLPGISPIQENTAFSNRYKQSLDKNTIKRAKNWWNLFSKYDMTPEQKISIIALMNEECNLIPKTINKEEVFGLGAKGTEGYANAGEGTIGFTHWDLKKSIIEQYNNHPNRKGPKLTTNKDEYSKASTRHISDLDIEDHALITYLFYKDLLNETKTNNLQDIMAKFYLKKAGTGFSKKGTLFERAIATGEHYRKYHEKKGWSSGKINKFLWNWGNAEQLYNIFTTS